MHVDDASTASSALCSQLNKTVPSHHFSWTVPVEWVAADQPTPVIHRAARRFESKSLFDPQVWLESEENFQSSSKHAPFPLPEITRDEKRFKKKIINEEKKVCSGKGTLFIFVFIVKESESFAIRIFLKVTLVVVEWKLTFVATVLGLYTAKYTFSHYQYRRALFDKKNLEPHSIQENSAAWLCWPKMLLFFNVWLHAPVLWSLRIISFRGKNPEKTNLEVTIRAK